MSLFEPVQMIGNLLTNIDTTLSRDDFKASDPRWQHLYALRKHLDDQQRALVASSSINPAPETYAAFTAQVLAANNLVSGAMYEPQRINEAIDQVAKATASIDNLLSYVEPGPKDQPVRRR